MIAFGSTRLSRAAAAALALLLAVIAPAGASDDTPKSAKRLSFPLVLAYDDCVSANTVHNSIQLYVSGIYQLAPGCVPAVPSSSLKFGPNGKGSVTLSLIPSIPDVKIVAKITDVRDGSNAPQTGPLSGVATVRISDNFCNNSGGGRCTPVDTALVVPGSCTAGVCKLNTTLNTALPGTIYPGMIASGEVVDFVILDGTNAPFLRPGLMVP